MAAHGLDRIKSVKDIPSLLAYLRDELGWPLRDEDVEDLTFDYDPAELGLDAAAQVKVRSVRQLRPLTRGQPWGVFFLEFEAKRLPVVVLRRILRALVPKKRASAQAAERAVWNLPDLLFIAASGETGRRGVSFAHFRDIGGGQAQLQTVSWDERETHFHYINLDLERLRWPRDPRDEAGWRAQWSAAFTAPHGYAVGTARELSAELARLAGHTRRSIEDLHRYEARDGSLHRLYDSFRKALLHDLDPQGFADMLAQTLAYGLFSVRATTGQPVDLEHLTDLPQTNPFLHDLLAELVRLSGRERGRIDFDELGVARLVALLNAADLEAVLRDFGRQSGGGNEDPVIHFYESFLRDYDASQKVERGVFYTPKPVVSFIVRSVHELLQSEFGLEDGLADTSTWGEMQARLPGLKLPPHTGRDEPFVRILDPATGTATFLETAIGLIYEHLTFKWMRQGKTYAEMRAAWNEYVPRHLLPRLYGFELMMAPYAIAHMKLGLKLKQTGYDFGSSERLRVYLTNTLEEPKDHSGGLFSSSIAHEAEAANRTKREVATTVVIGNPPYSGHSSNNGKWIRELLRRELADGADSYFRVDGQDLGERNPKWLNDDYVKFIRFAQDRVATAGAGVLAYITNHSYLDNPTFRGMRQSLTRTFGLSYLLDLHGNTKKKERAPDGSKDENVFDIQQGTAVGIFVKQPGAEDDRPRIFARGLWGLRQTKYSAFTEVQLYQTAWAHLRPSFPFYLFTEQNLDLRAEFDHGWRLAELMQINVLGFQTHRDQFAIAFNGSVIHTRISDLREGVRGDNDLYQMYDLYDNRDWQLSTARRLVRRDSDWERYIIPCTFRPFDERWTYFSTVAMDYPRRELLDHVAGKSNLCLLAIRQMMDHIPYTHIFISHHPSVDRVFACSRGAATVFPLYLYPESRGLTLGNQDRRSNFHARFLSDLAARLGLTFVRDGRGDLKRSFGPEDVLHYIYAILQAPSYRERYVEFLKIDFPRVPLPTGLELFRGLCALGGELVALHLLESPELERPSVAFCGTDRELTKVGEKGKTLAQEKDGRGRLYVNKTSYFDGVPLEVWNFQVGGYQVCHKWLDDRRKAGRSLSEEDIAHYQKVVTALAETIRVMGEIDALIEEHGGWPLEGSVPEAGGGAS